MRRKGGENEIDKKRQKNKRHDKGRMREKQKRKGEKEEKKEGERAETNLREKGTYKANRGQAKQVKGEEQTRKK